MSPVQNLSGEYSIEMRLFYSDRKVVNELIEISWIHFIILSLASFRLTHLIVFDDITLFLRNPFISVSYKTDENGGTIKLLEIKGSGFQYWIGSILSCHWCTGIWSSLIVMAVYCFLPIAFPLLIMLAIAGAAAIIETKLLS